MWGGACSALKFVVFVLCRSWRLVCGVSGLWSPWCQRPVCVCGMFSVCCVGVCAGIWAPSSCHPLALNPESPKLEWLSLACRCGWVCGGNGCPAHPVQVFTSQEVPGAFVGPLRFFVAERKSRTTVWDSTVWTGWYAAGWSARWEKGDGWKAGDTPQWTASSAMSFVGAESRRGFVLPASERPLKTATSLMEPVRVELEGGPAERRTPPGRASRGPWLVGPAAWTRVISWAGGAQRTLRVVSTEVVGRGVSFVADRPLEGVRCAAQ